MLIFTCKNEYMSDRSYRYYCHLPYLYIFHTNPWNVAHLNPIINHSLKKESIHLNGCPRGMPTTCICLSNSKHARGKKKQKKIVTTRQKSAHGRRKSKFSAHTRDWHTIQQVGRRRRRRLVHPARSGRGPRHGGRSRSVNLPLALRRRGGLSSLTTRVIPRIYCDTGRVQQRALRSHWEGKVKRSP